LVEEFVRAVGADTDAWELRFARKFGIGNCLYGDFEVKS
jgi:hypothetical protein